MVSTIDLDPWGGETAKSSNQAFAPRRFTTYERDGNGRDQAGARQYHGWFSRFDQADPYRGSYDLADPQSFNRYAYVQNDPVNFVDPSGLRLGLIYDLLTVNETVDVLGFIDDLTGGGATSGPDMLALDHEKWDTRLNSQKPEDRLKALIEQYQKGRCKEFLESMLAELGNLTGTVPASTNPLQLLGSIKVISRPNLTGYGGARGTVGGKNAEFDMRFLDRIDDPNSRSTPNFENFRTGVHEITHVAPGSPGRIYTHEEMARAARIAAGSNAAALPGERLYTGSALDEAYSNYFDAEVWKACWPGG